MLKTKTYRVCVDFLVDGQPVFTSFETDDLSTLPSDLHECTDYPKYDVEILHVTIIAL